jgi:hypothetical protein
MELIMVKQLKNKHSGVSFDYYASGAAVSSRDRISISATARVYK